MLTRNLLGVGASLLLVAAACGSKGSSGTGGSGAGASGSGSGAGTSSTSAGSGAASASSSGAAGSGSSGTAMCTGPGYITTGSIFQVSEPWNTPVDQAPVDPQSATILDWLSSAGGWGNNNQFQIDTSITVLCADASTPMRAFSGGAGNTDPMFCGLDCDSGHTTFPVPMGGAIEGLPTYACTTGGDCHLLVVDLSRNWLWEMYGAFSPADPKNFYSVGGAIIWDLTHAYGPTLRGDGCTSSDAGGFPVAAMLFSADEIVAGHIDHAIRFTLPNTSIRDGDVYVHPATHTGVASSPGNPTRPDAPPYGVQLRLKASFDLTKLKPTAQVVAKALQKYGMFLSDGGGAGDIALTATSDMFTNAKWPDADVDIGSKDLTAIQVTDFEVVNLTPVITTGDSCTLNGYRVP